MPTLAAIRPYLYLGAIVFYFGSCGYVWFKAKHDCEVTGKLKGDEKVITVRENQNATRNLRPDARSLAGQLHVGHF